MKRIIFFDIDGTLLDEETQVVSQSTRDAIKKAQDNGHLCIINTGRARCALNKIITDMNFDGYICGCGTYVEFQGKEILHARLNDVVKKLVIQASIDDHMDSVLEGKNGIYFPGNYQHSFISNIIERYTKENFPIETYVYDKVSDFDKFASWYHQDSDVDHFKEIISPYFDIIQRDIDFIEVIPKGCSKSTGIQVLIDYLNMTLDQTISVGDSTNDLAMLEYTKESVAMGNSNPVLFDIVTYTTTDIRDNGIYNALKHFEVI